MKQCRIKTLSMLLCFLLLLSLAPVSSFGCETPVYQYALANWYPDLYRFYVLYEGREGLDILDQVNRLRFSAGEGGHSLNLEIIPVDAMRPDAELPQSIRKEALAALNAQRLPSAVLMAPRLAGPSDPLWIGGVEWPDWLEIIDSPVRKESARLIVDELACGIFLFVEQKPGAKSEKQKKQLKKYLGKMEKKLRPSVDDGKVKVHFPVLQLTADQFQQEKLLLRLLAQESADGKLPEENFAAVLYGRGRMMELIPASLFNEKSIRAACEYLLGECSCEIKAQNPGFDLLVRGAWSSADLPLTYQEFQLPQLISVDMSEEGAHDGGEEPLRSSRPFDAGDGESVVENPGKRYVIYLIPLFVLLVSVLGYWVFLLFRRSGR